MEHPFPVGSKVRVVKASGFSHQDFAYSSYYFRLGDVCEILGYIYNDPYHIHPKTGKSNYVYVRTATGVQAGIHIEAFASLVKDDFEETGVE